MRYLIAGNGVAGTRAAETLRQHDPHGEIVLLSAEEVPFYRRPALVDHLAGRVSLADLWGRPEPFYREKSVQLRLGQSAVGLDPQAHRLTLAGGEALAYDRLLLAVGIARRVDWVPGAGLQGVFSLQRLADLSALRAFAEGARAAVVVGEGVIGVEMARAFRILGIRVTYLIPGPRFWADAIGPEASTLVEERLRSEGVEVRPNQVVQEFLGKSRVHAVSTSSGEQVEAGLVGLSAGLGPVLPWAEAAGLKMEGDRIQVDDSLATSLPDVYAAGDAVRLPGEAVPYGWLRAWHQGAAAGANLAGAGVPFRRRTVTLSTRVFGMPILVTGNPNPAGQKVRRERGDYPQGGVYKELVIDDEGRVVGAVMVGEVSEAGKVEDLVRRQVPYGQADPKLLRALFDSRYWLTSRAEILCPVCKYLIQIGEQELREGRITCPICGAEFGLRPTGDRFVVVLEQGRCSVRRSV